ncbi:MAG: signal peptidase I [Zestosphaera tikiterensis]|uniref:Signal peptidase I n=1 Tax=Zestosphaera tikiterensis TaxID=1973259 RepID=A0A2R7Y7F5_9CREN|nr:MAG: signal peptidase I [Zestosphaera tikiterensis]
MTLKTRSFLELLMLTLLILLIVLTSSKAIMFAVVEGRSMEPLLQTGDIVLVVNTDVGRLNVGDVVVYEKADGTYIIHRIIGINNANSCFIIKGDNNLMPDGCIASSKIVGKVLSVGTSVVKVPALGYITLLFKALFKTT